MNWRTDEEVKKLFNEALTEDKKRERETITRWRNGSRSPKLSEILTIENHTHIPFEAFLRNANLEQIEKQTTEMLKNLRKLIKEKKERENLQKELKKWLLA